MSTKSSEIRRLSAAKKSTQVNAERPGGSIARLGDVKVETKGHDGDGDIDNFQTMDRYND